MSPPPPRTVLGLGASAYCDYSLARALTLLGARDVDGVNWYVAGAAGCVSTQRPDGSWFAGDPAAPDVLETAWRLAFLARATLPEVALGDREEWD